MRFSHSFVIFSLFLGCANCFARISIGCGALFLEGSPIKQKQTPAGLWQVQKIPFSGWETWIAAESLPGGRVLTRIGRASTRYRDCTEASKICQAHVDQLSAVTLSPSFQAYGERRNDWDFVFIDLLKMVAPTFRSDSHTFAILNEAGAVEASIRLVPSFSKPDSDAVLGHGYEDTKAFRLPVVDWSNGRPLFQPPENEWVSFSQPPGQGPGEQILGMKLDRTGLDVVWELTNFYIQPNLKAAVRRELWLRLWRAVIDYIFFRSDSFARQSLFTYGSESSLKLYRPLGIVKLNEYWIGGKRVSGANLPPIKIGETDFWPMNWTPQAMKQFHAKMREEGNELAGEWPLDKFEGLWLDQKK